VSAKQRYRDKRAPINGGVTMKINPYLVFNGTCADAMTFYNTVLGGKLDMMKFGGSPAAEHVPASSKDKIIHACLSFDDHCVMASDCMPGQPEDMKGMSVALHYDKPEDAERVFAALSERGSITMPIGETFWAKRFGTCVDRFGTPWMINCSKPMPEFEQAMKEQGRS
jgi:PhnB protein